MWNSTSPPRLPSACTNARHRWQANTRSMKFSRMPASFSRPSSSTGTRGKRSVKARAKMPTPRREGFPFSS